MKIDLIDLIKFKYNSVEEMIEKTAIDLSVGYVYQIANKKRNITIKVAKELCKVLDINSIDMFANMIGL